MPAGPDSGASVSSVTASRMLRDSTRLFARASLVAPEPNNRSNNTCGLRSTGNGVRSSSQEIVSRIGAAPPFAAGVGAVLDAELEGRQQASPARCDGQPPGRR